MTSKNNKCRGCLIYEILTPCPLPSYKCPCCECLIKIVCDLKCEKFQLFYRKEGYLVFEKKADCIKIYSGDPFKTNETKVIKVIYARKKNKKIDKGENYT